MMPHHRTHARRRQPGESPARPRWTREDHQPRYDLYSAHSRADAIADRVLYEVSDRLTTAFRLPCRSVVFTAAWSDVVAWTVPELDRTPGMFPRQSESDRLAAVLWEARTAYETDLCRHQLQIFSVWRVPRSRPEVRPEMVTLSLTLHPGDHGETVATIAHFRELVTALVSLSDHPATVWPVVGLDPAQGEDQCPIVTAETLDRITADQASSSLDLRRGFGGTVYVRAAEGPWQALTPDHLDRYHLAPLRWPWRLADSGDQPQGEQ